MRNTLRKQITNGLYEKEFVHYLQQGYSLKKIGEALNISDYAIFICKWHLYQKYQVWTKKDLIEITNDINYS